MTPRPDRGEATARRRPLALRERFETAIVVLYFRALGALPLDWASALGGAIARTIGPLLPVTRLARENLALALPELTPAQARRIIRAMWDNFGRTVAEYPHLARIRCFGPGARIDLVGTEHVDRAVADGRPLIFFSGHFGNWEVGSLAAAQYGLPTAIVYRAANNARVETLMHALRRSLGVEPLAKGATGARRIIAALREGKTLMMLIDQKMNDGIAVPFFGRDAMTAPALAELTLRYDCTLLPARVDRLDGARFRVTIFPPLPLPRSGDRRADIGAIMFEANRTLEAWIRERPERWLWLHRRWPRSP
jgi:KDO2-lipid IV(A) lauroyltransferase